MSGPTPADKLFELVAYFISCARLALDEPVIYGSFRLVEGVVRLTDAAEALDLELDDQILTARESIEREKLRMIDDHEGYRRWLDELLAEIAGEAARRNLQQPTA